MRAGAPDQVPEDLDPRPVALVCGATGAIGGAIARRLTAAGAVVVVHGHANAERAGALSGALGGASIPLTADLCDPAAVAGLFAEVAASVGPPEIVVNAAYPPAPDRPVRETTPDDAHAHHAALLMHLNVCREAVAAMEPRGTGRIVLVSAAMADRPFPGTALYAATTAALNAFSRTLALEVGKAGITVNVIAPGKVRSDELPEPAEPPGPYADLERISKLRAALPAPPSPADIADLTAYLVSPGAAAVTGQVIHLAAGEPI
ncbi:MAG: SDR family oxidoreductase [Actinobacteria bacterium]|nr:SDR family oxidoreductase [Actinomycetota bacterium]